MFIWTDRKAIGVLHAALPDQCFPMFCSEIQTKGLEYRVVNMEAYQPPYILHSYGYSFCLAFAISFASVGIKGERGLVMYQYLALHNFFFLEKRLK